jgi:hypothetical protein
VIAGFFLFGSSRGKLRFGVHRHGFGCKGRGRGRDDG